MLPERQRLLGERAEERYRLELRASVKRCEIQAFCRPEWLVFPTYGEPYLVEVKGQEIFVPPPFHGHGIPIRQANTYAAAHRLIGLRTKLVIYDPSQRARYEAWLDELEARGSEFVFDTSGNSTGRRRVYAIDGFNVAALAA